MLLSEARPPTKRSALRQTAVPGLRFLESDVVLWGSWCGNLCTRKEGQGMELLLLLAWLVLVLGNSFSKPLVKESV